MSKYCYAKGCNTSTYVCQRGYNIRRPMYRFPSNPELRKLWADALLVKNRQQNAVKLPKHARVCVLHFEDECIEQFGFSHVRLKPNSVPSIFPNAPREESVDIKSAKNTGDNDISHTDVKIDIKSEPEGSIGSPSQSEQLGEFEIVKVDPVQEFNEQHMSNDIPCRDFKEPTNHDPPKLQLRYPAQVTESSIKSMSPILLRKACMMLKKAYERKNNMVKNLQTEKRRNIKKINTLVAMLLEIKRKNLLKENTSDTIESPSTIALSLLEPEINLDLCSDESVLQDEEEGEDSDAEINNADMLDVTMPQILLDEVDPLLVEVNTQYPTSSKECELFRESVAKHLQQLPFDVAFKLRSRIQTLVMQSRTEYIRQHPSKGSTMVKIEALGGDEPIRTCYTKTTNQPASDDSIQIRGEKRLQNNDLPKTKRFNIDKRSPEIQSSNSETTHGQHKRTEHNVFAEHIALQLEQLPDDLSLQVKSDIYKLIKQAPLKLTGQDASNSVKIKDEIIEGAPSQMMDEQSCETV